MQVVATAYVVRAAGEQGVEGVAIGGRQPVGEPAALLLPHCQLPAPALHPTLRPSPRGAAAAWVGAGGVAILVWPAAAAADEGACLAPYRETAPSCGVLFGEAWRRARRTVAVATR